MVLVVCVHSFLESCECLGNRSVFGTSISRVTQEYKRFKHGQEYLPLKSHLNKNTKGWSVARFLFLADQFAGISKLPFPHIIILPPVDEQRLITILRREQTLGELACCPRGLPATAWEGRGVTYIHHDGTLRREGIRPCVRRVHNNTHNLYPHHSCHSHGQISPLIDSYHKKI